ncbi:hypothetical protein NMY22_g8126 [Coprinellus aureogranulatus]|nr:hypothetical protein NMY22_g8126 [Coprinellus aureogranulatus]
MPFIKSFLSTLLLATSIAQGMPISVTPLEYEYLSTRAASCYPVTLEQLQKLPAWNKVVKYAEDHWGSGGVFMSTILRLVWQYPERGADACMNVASVQAKWSSEPSCETNKGEQQGTATNGQLTVGWKAAIGTSSKASWTVTHASELTAGVEYSITAEIPAVASLSSKISMSGTVRNEKSSSFETSNDQTTEQNFEFQNEPGNQCKFEVETTTCKATATASVPVAATGRVWFFYNEARKDKVTGQADGHYHWSVSLDEVLTEQERTSQIEIKGPVNTQSRSVYTLHCVPLNAAAKRVVSKTPSQALTATPKPTGKTGTTRPAGKPAAQSARTDNQTSESVVDGLSTLISGMNEYRLTPFDARVDDGIQFSEKH